MKYKLEIYFATYDKVDEFEMENIRVVLQEILKGNLREGYFDMALHDDKREPFDHFFERTKN